MVGTPAKKVISCDCISASAALASKRGSSTSVAPIAKPAFIWTVCPKEWNSGSVTRWVSRFRACRAAEGVLIALSVMLACVSSAPLG